MFRPVKTKKVYEEIIEQIKKLIVDGKLQPGDKLLSERELSDKLNVSRASVREAFSALEMMGIIAIRPGEGSFVRQVSFEGMLEPLSFLIQVEIDDIMQLLEVRKILEVETAALAATRVTPANLEAIQRAIQNMMNEVRRGEIGDNADSDFHFAVAAAANNPILIKMMGTISDLMAHTFRSSRQKLFMVENMPMVLYNSHVGIYEAIAGKNPNLARRRMREHLNMVEEAMKTLKSGGISSLKNLREISPEYKIRDDFGFPS
ncbi:MAG: FadR/GntR family transcriptional regulator [Negativicutes bacterium]|nr:FadR/GntR family transcriptional regulator [Negativicutes bacterium]